MSSSKKGSLTPPTCPLAQAAAPPSSTSTDSESWQSAGFESEWHYRFALLSATLGRQWISSDKLQLIAYQLEREAGREAALEFVEHAVLNRDRKVHNFMG